MGEKFLIVVAMLCCYGQLVIGGANASEIMRVDARDYPFSAIGRLNLGGSGYCSAVLIGPDLVLSAASCLYNRTEGRWWGKNELFFQGGYQFETAGNQAGIADYAAPRAYRPGGRLTLGSARVDFALLKLKSPIGYRAGWLGLRWNDAALERDRLARRLTLHHAGYVRNLQHVQVIDSGCKLSVSACALSPQRLALRPLVEKNGGFYALPLRARATAGGRAKLKRITRNLLRRLGYKQAETPAPRIGARKPVRTVSLLLNHLGHAPQGPAKRASRLSLGDITAFRKEIGRRPDGRVNPRLLGDILRATRDAGSALR